MIGRPIQHHRPQNFCFFLLLLFVWEREPRPVYIYKVRCARLAVIFTTDNFSLFIHECVYTHTSRRLFLFIYFLYHNAYRHT
jgi:hypothetical protein